MPDYDKKGDSEDVKVKIICLGDSAVGKSKYCIVHSIAFTLFCEIVSKKLMTVLLYSICPVFEHMFMIYVSWIHEYSFDNYLR